MLEWHQIKGYDRKKDYRYQEEVELPELEEEILIQFVDEIRPDRPPFVGYFKQKDTGIWIIDSLNQGTLYEVQDGIYWARFNIPDTKKEKDFMSEIDMKRDMAYRRYVRNKTIQRKKRINKAVYGLEWYKHDGQYSKGKIHCGCGLCKYGRKFGLPTVRDMREISREKLLMEGYESNTMY